MTKTKRANDHRYGRRNPRTTSTPFKILMRHDFILRRLCDRLKYCRKRSRLSFEQIQTAAAKLGLEKGFSKAQILNDERYDCRVDGIRKLSVYAMIYGVSFIWLAEFKGLRRPDRHRTDDQIVIDRILSKASNERMRVYRGLLEVVHGEIDKASKAE